MANIKSYDSQLSGKVSEGKALQLTVDQLQYFKDSALVRMDSLRKVLKIKDKSLKALQYIASNATKADTIILRDTVFRETRNKDSILVDTLIGDAWYKADIKLKYPHYIILRPQFKSEKYIMVSTKKETVNPPKKFWLFRIFQRKHEVVTVDIVEKSPYIQDSTSKYVQIIK